MYLVGKSPLRLIQPLRQQPLRAHGDHLSGDNEHDHQRATQNQHRAQSVPGQQVVGEQHRVSEKTDIGQCELHRCHEPSVKILRRPRRQLQQRVSDEQRAEEEPDATPQFAAGRADTHQIGDSSV